MEAYIEEKQTIADALRLLNKNEHKILFLHNQGKLIGDITEDEICEWIIKKGDLHAPVKFAANDQPMYLYECQANEAVRIIEEYGVEAIPIIDKTHRIKTIVFGKSSLPKREWFGKDIPVVIMAGGHGTRLMPYTKILPKPLLPVGEDSMVEHIINCFYSYGCRRFYMLVNYKKDVIKAYFNGEKRKYSLEFVAEEQALGTGGGLSLLKEKVNETFVLINCDTWIGDHLDHAYRHHVSSGNLITIVCAVKNFSVPYGVVNLDENGEVLALREKPDMFYYVNTGCYFVEPQIIKKLRYNCPIDFTDIIKEYIDQEKKVGIYPILERDWLDMGQADGLEEMRKRMENRKKG